MHPNADPNLIRLRYTGVEQSEILSNGSLVLHTSSGKLVEAPLLIFQEIDGKRHEIEGHYIVEDVDDLEDSLTNHQSKIESRTVLVSIGLATYNPAYPLVIDPELVFSSYLGGFGGDIVGKLVVDNDESIYLAGETTSTNFPLQNPIQADVGSRDIFVTKLITTNGVYTYAFSTYIGGNGVDDVISGLVVDNNDSIYLAGQTRSTDFPTHNPGPAQLWRK